MVSVSGDRLSRARVSASPSSKVRARTSDASAPPLCRMPIQTNRHCGIRKLSSPILDITPWTASFAQCFGTSHHLPFVTTSHNTNMATTTESWQEKADAKRESLHGLIPESWRLKDPIPSSEKQRDVTGKFLWPYLSNREIEITESNAVDIVSHTTTGGWTAEEVTKAFCHRASLAHQIVR